MIRVRYRLVALGVVVAVAAAAVTAVAGTPPGSPAALATAPRTVQQAVAPVRTCESLTSVALTNVTVSSAISDPGNATTPASCRVTATSTHPPSGDQIRIDVWLPISTWNSRFQGTGGGGFSGGGPGSLPGPLRAGYAAGATDTGHVGGSGSFALTPQGRLNWTLIRDNAHVGIHEMTVVGKALTEAFYGTPPRYSYFNGCSTGGRQGLSEAQRYPADYDGILAGAPAINWHKLHPAQLWGPLVMLESGNVVPQCKFAAATAAAVVACDTIDEVADGVIEDPERCKYDPAALVGTSTACGTITDADADVIRRIWEGPRRLDGSFLWYGLTRGASFGGLSNTGGTPLEPRPFFITLEWFRYWLKMDPSWDWRTTSFEEYEQLFDQSVEEFGTVIGTDNPDLSAFRERDGKILMWHGQADPLIYPQGSIDYFQRVQRLLGEGRTDRFLRLFMAPGVGHCGGGVGPAPTGQLEALVKWVEEGVAPDTLTAVSTDANGNVVRSRPLCAYPLVARYTGNGSTDDAANFRCKRGF
jgi:Tannase and feruloyl esterase